MEKNLSSAVSPNEIDFCDIDVLIPGLIRLFSRKIHKLPSNHAIMIHKMLISFLERHCVKPVLKNFNKSRILVSFVHF